MLSKARMMTAMQQFQRIFPHFQWPVYVYKDLVLQGESWVFGLVVVGNGQAHKVGKP
jgi:hypothetical protein